MVQLGSHPSLTAAPLLSLRALSVGPQQWGVRGLRVPMQRLHSQLSVFWPCAKDGKQEAQVERTLHGLWVCVHLAFYRPRRGTPSSEGGRGGGGKGGGSHELQLPSRGPHFSTHRRVCTSQFAMAAPAHRMVSTAMLVAARITDPAASARIALSVTSRMKYLDTNNMARAASPRNTFALAGPGAKEVSRCLGCP
jgi:hypothetical protein